MKRILLLFTVLFIAQLSFAQRDGFDRNGRFDVNPLFEDLMMPAEGGDFRGVDFDMTREKINSIETDRETVSLYDDEQEDIVIYTTDMGADIMDFADITYKFDEIGLYHIKVESYSTSREKNDAVYEKIEDFYTDRLGKGTLADDDYLEFDGKSDGKQYVVALQRIDIEDAEGIYMYIYLSE